MSSSVQMQKKLTYVKKVRFVLYDLRPGGNNNHNYDSNYYALLEKLTSIKHIHYIKHFSKNIKYIFFIHLHNNPLTLLLSRF